MRRWLWHRENAKKHGLAERVRFVKSNLLAAVEDEEQFDAVLSNPPYIPEGDRTCLHRQVRDFEPEMALFAGAEGLDIYRRLIPAVADRLKPGGLLALEIGYGQRGAVEEMLRNWNRVEVLDDLQGVPRTILARTSEIASR